MQNKLPSIAFTRFFTSVPIKQVPSIVSGKFNYNETFAAFVKGTNQKKDTALVVGAFAKKLQEKQVLLNQLQPMTVADIGCADSTTCLQYLKTMHQPSGFHYIGIDTNQRFIQEAKINLSHEPIIKQYSLLDSDVFSGKLKENKELASLSFQFIFVSHVAYYIKNELMGRVFLEDVMKLLSKPCGIAVFLHEDSTYYFRSTYNKDQFQATSTPMLLERSAQFLPANFNQFKSINFTSKLHFFPISNDLWEAAKHPEHYKYFSCNSHFIDTLEKLAFIVQSDLTALAKEGCLSRYIDEIKGAIVDNNYSFDLETRMQTLVTPDCTLKHKIAKALKETEEEMPSILHRNAMDSSITLHQNPTGLSLVRP